MQLQFHTQGQNGFRVELCCSNIRLQRVPILTHNCCYITFWKPNWNLVQFKKLDKERIEIPTCDSVCIENWARQPDYDDFNLLNKTYLASLCEFMDQKKANLDAEICKNVTSCEKNMNKFNYCPFNVKIRFDYNKFGWIRSDGSEIKDFAWVDQTFPAYNDVLVYYYDDYTLRLNRPVSHVSKYSDLCTALCTAIKSNCPLFKHFLLN